MVRRQLRKSEVERARYRQAIHFVTHEMRSPLTAIQGSSELMGRYNLNEDKRKQIAAMINSESKRLARMIQTFLDVERLADGQMELKREPIGMHQVLDACMDRVRPLAERKNIQVTVEEPIDGDLLGDRELMEYAVYNLLTNAIKYSPADTKVAVSSHPDSGFLRLSIKDQGIGMDSRELKQIFTRFYRTKRAEASGRGRYRYRSFDSGPDSDSAWRPHRGNQRARQRFLFHGSDSRSRSCAKLDIYKSVFRSVFPSRRPFRPGRFSEPAGFSEPGRFSEPAGFSEP